MARKRAERRHTDMSQRARWLEIAIAVVASIISSSTMAAWLLSSKLTGFEKSIEAERLANADQEALIMQMRAGLTGESTINATQTAQIAVSDSRYQEINRRLDTIDQKVDRLVERR